MVSPHRKAVNRVYEALKPFEDDPRVRWDYVGREVDYYRTPDTSDCDPKLMFQQKGDFDILALDYQNEMAYIVEIKTNNKYTNQGYNQLKRAEEHFRALGWETIPCLLVDDGEIESMQPSYASD